MRFTELVENSKLLRAIEEMGYKEATPIQESVIPLISMGKDVIARSQTGTGKTAAFAVPVLEKVEESIAGPQVLILCPTRELSVQVAGEFRKLLSFFHHIKVLAVYGGEPIYRQIMALKRGVQIIVGTPGRIMDHMERKTLRFRDVHTVILDEADEMLKMGFREDIEKILKDVPEQVQTLLFSATMPKEIVTLAEQFMREPEEVKIEAAGITTETVKQSYCAVKKEKKPQALFRILEDKSPERCMIFCNTKKMVDEITDALQEKGFWADKIHGDLKQELRMGVLEKFNKGILHSLVCTDVAARGLDIQNVDLVINYDVPDKEDYYVHRIGRSGRAGKAGEAITIATKSDHFRFQNIEAYIKIKIEKMQIPSQKNIRKKTISRFIEHIVLEMDQESMQEYEDILRILEEKGYSAKQLAMALLKQTLELEELEEEIDVNDYRFDAPKADRFSRKGNRREEERIKSDSKKERGRRKEKSEEIHKDKADRNQKSKDKEKRSLKGKDKSARSLKGREKNEKGMTRIFLSAGTKHKISVRDIVGALVGETSIDPRHIGSVDMYDKFSFVDVKKESVKNVLSHLQNKRIKGRKLNVEMANE